MSERVKTSLLLVWTAVAMIVLAPWVVAILGRVIA